MNKKTDCANSFINEKKHSDDKKKIPHGEKHEKTGCNNPAFKGFSSLHKLNLSFDTGQNTNKLSRKNDLSREQRLYLSSLRLFNRESLRLFSNQLDFRVLVKLKYFNGFSIESVYFIELNFESIKELMFNLN